ncbi:hypothetical protein TNCT_36041 [Trichonephila clavata]|uniref:Uncharacterized protein n=1 Tax=Trichonephila clavata TaxID=2740835 RepID=A0A8X6L7K4_TRICU|nr:hypothetical protein TNCT_36041 [Trichonephila clavata]
MWSLTSLVYDGRSKGPNVLDILKKTENRWEKEVLKLTNGETAEKDRTQNNFLVHLGIDSFHSTKTDYTVNEIIFSFKWRI